MHGPNEVNIGRAPQHEPKKALEGTWTPVQVMYWTDPVRMSNIGTAEVVICVDVRVKEGEHGKKKKKMEGMINRINENPNQPVDELDGENASLAGR